MRGIDGATFNSDIESNLREASSFSEFRESILMGAAISRQSLERRHDLLKSRFVCSGEELLQLMGDLSVNADLSSSLVVPTCPNTVVFYTGSLP